MRRTIRAIGAGLALIAPGPATAITPYPSAGDPRVAEVLYGPDQVIEVNVALGFQASVEFDPAERIENVAIGDALGWQVTPNRRANLLFLKPTQRRPRTNMTVVTNLRRYNFELAVTAARTGHRRAAAPYSIRIVYPPPAISTPTPAEPVQHAWQPQDLNNAYSYKGSGVNLPARVFDDGRFTYFRFADGTDVPAILAVEADGGELVVNTSMREGYVIVDTVARGFVLRRGSEVTTLYNDGFQAPTPGPLAPKPRSRKTGWFSR